jgi:WD40 repeat protein
VKLLAFTSQGYLLSAGRDGLAKTWNPQGRLEQRLYRHGAPVTKHAVSLAGLIATADSTGEIRLWDAVKHRAMGRLRGHRSPGGVTALAFSRKGVLASAGADGIRLWNPHTGTQIGGTRPEPAVNVAFSPDGTWVASDTGDGTLHLWRLGGHRMKRSIPIGSAFTMVGFAATNTLVTTDRISIRAWKIATGAQVGAPLVVANANRPITDITISADGTTLAVSSYDVGQGRNAIRLWDPRTRRQLGEALVGSLDFVSDVALSADGTSLAAMASSRVRLWDVRSHQPIAEPELGEHLAAHNVFFDYDGRGLVLADNNGAISELDLAAQRWQSRLCALLNRNLTASEWDTFVGPEIPYRATCLARATARHR